MFSYSVTVFSGEQLDSGTSDHVYIKLVGMKGESRWELIPSEGLQTEKSCTFTIECSTSLGELVMVELDKLALVVPDDWFCAKVTVVTPEEDTAHFPWLSDDKVHYFREEKAKKEFDDVDPLVKSYREEKLKERAQDYRCLTGAKRTEHLQINNGTTKASYRVTVHTGDLRLAGTSNWIYIKLVGTQGKSGWLSANSFLGFFRGQKYSLDIDMPTSLGELVFLELKTGKLPDDWFCAKVTVVTPENHTAHFPCYRWIPANKVHEFREGKAKRAVEDDIEDEIHRLAKSHREKELQDRAQDYIWDEHAGGLPHSMKSKCPLSLPFEVRFSFTKGTQFLLTAVTDQVELYFKGLRNLEEPWKSIDDIPKAFSGHHTPISDYVQKHWKDDTLFGYQFLNGVNPTIIEKCLKLPKNFPVTDNMIRASLHGASSLTDEIKKGNIYLVDYKQLDGVTANVINGKQQYLTAPLVLLQKTPDDKLIPIAIQLKQKPGEDNPIFFPTDSEYDWLLAKIFVRSAHFNEHELNAHLLRTHLLSEVFAVALLRNLPMVHPLYKLLIPHTRYTLQINALARTLLISKFGVFTQYSASGGEGMFTILQRAVSCLTYSSLCLPEDIAARHMESIPNFYYRDDGLRLWDVIHRFVQGVIGHHYKSDWDVQKDSELQNWIKDIFKHGFLSRASSGIPQDFETLGELVKFVTMVIFTGSAQHSAVNSGQFDYGGWPVNAPISLQLPPPTTKGQSSESTMLQTLPDFNVTANGVATLWLLSQESTDFVPLGEYPHEHFSEDAPCRLIKEFQAELKTVSESVKARNSSLEVPYKYTYLDPEQMENSVAL